MQIYNQSKKRMAILKNYTDLAIETTLNTGDKTIEFRNLIKDSLSDSLICENYIKTQNDWYVIKSVALDGEYKTISGNLNLEELEDEKFPDGFESVEATVLTCLQLALAGTKWTVGETNITKKRTIRKKDKCSPLDVIKQCISTYHGEIKYDTFNKKVNFYEQIGADKGCYFMEDLNLKSLKIDNTTYDICTRLTPIGKDSLNINVDGKNYIENHQYTNKVISRVWKDDRYTTLDSLLEDAIYKLDEVSKPYTSYSTDIINLAKISSSYDVLDYSIGDAVTIISKSKSIKEKQRIVKIREYPQNPSKNTCELANIKKTFAEMQMEAAEELSDITQQEITAAEETAKSYADILAEDMENKVKEMYDDLNSREGLFCTVEKKLDGSYIFYMHDKPDLSDSVTIWKMTSDSIAVSTDGGKNYTYGITADGDTILRYIKAKGLSADWITSGILSAVTILTEDCFGNTLEIGGGSLSIKLLSGAKLQTMNRIEANTVVLAFGNDSGFSNQTVIDGTYISTPKLLVGSKTSYSGEHDSDFCANGRSWLVNQVIASEDVKMEKSLTVNSNLTVYGTKNRIVPTENYGEVLLYCEESASPLFTDLGSAETDENGICYVMMDSIFAETIAEQHEYYVFLTKCGNGDIYIQEKHNDYFIVKGTPNIKFDWEIKAKQKGYEMQRFEQKEESISESNYELEAINYLENYMKEVGEYVD